MQDNVEQLRMRWTPELTTAAIRLLQSQSVAVDIPTMEHEGMTYLDLRGIRIEQTQLDGAIIRNANLRWAIIRDVGFKSAQLVRCNLGQTVLSDCYFRDTVFQQCNIINARFDNSDFSGARIEDSQLDFTSFKGCEITLRTIRFRDDISPRALVRVCRNLKLNAMAMGHFADAGELTYMEKTHERHVLYRHAFTHEHERVGERAKAMRDWATSFFLNWLWGYGEKPHRLTLVMAVAIVFFGTIQYWMDGIPGNSFGSHLYFSGITFLTIGYGDLVPVAPIPRFLALVEGAVGMTVLGMLIASWTKKIMYR